MLKVLWTGQSPSYSLPQSSQTENINIKIYITKEQNFLCHQNRIGGVMVNELVSSRSWVRACRVKPDYKIGICCFSTKHAALRRKSRLAGSESG